MKSHLLKQLPKLAAILCTAAAFTIGQHATAQVPGYTIQYQLSNAVATSSITADAGVNPAITLGGGMYETLNYVGNNKPYAVTWKTASGAGTGINTGIITAVITNTGAGNITVSTGGTVSVTAAPQNTGQGGGFCEIENTPQYSYTRDVVYNWALGSIAYSTYSTYSWVLAPGKSLTLTDEGYTTPFETIGGAPISGCGYSSQVNVSITAGGTTGPTGLAESFNIEENMFGTADTVSGSQISEIAAAAGFNPALIISDTPVKADTEEDLSYNLNGTSKYTTTLTASGANDSGPTSNESEDAIYITNTGTAPLPISLTGTVTTGPLVPGNPSLYSDGPLVQVTYAATGSSGGTIVLNTDPQTVAQETSNVSWTYSLPAGYVLELTNEDLARAYSYGDTWVGDGKYSLSLKLTVGN